MNKLDSAFFQSLLKIAGHRDPVQEPEPTPIIETAPEVAKVASAGQMSIRDIMSHDSFAEGMSDGGARRGRDIVDALSGLFIAE